MKTSSGQIRHELWGCDMAAVATDVRVASPIASRGEVSHLVQVPPQRLTSWMHPTRNRRPLVHSMERNGRLTIPLVGIAEAASLRGLRDLGLSMQQARRAAEFVRDTYANEYALASPKLVTDGTDAFFEDDKGLVRVRDRQGAIKEVLKDHLRPLILDSNGFVEAFRVEEFTSSMVTIDPRFNAGRMSFVRNRVPLFAVAGALKAGESVEDIADDFGLQEGEALEVERLLEWLARTT